uniref:Uncharacterized protein n=1 Tax=Globisporangium ultimum (strain ATCC 200006 / CBS 805.95 / DAOM BR144) TaxID=431595 RepID=K3WZT6_GLOUD
MGKAAQRRRDEKRRALFETHGDARSSEEQTRARAMLDALQRKLEDDALREDGFYFVDGEYVAARRPRTTAGMNMRAFDGHTRRVKSLALVCFPQGAEQDGSRSFLVTFGLDRATSGFYLVLDD